jgi:ectoine hydroxylase-related dioxygenase (phytanoyl-CoA dioxygenase family)
VNNRFAFLEMQVSNDLLDDPSALRGRLAADGYLYFRQVLDRDRVAEVGQAITKTTRKLGWTQAGPARSNDVCIVTPLRESDEAFVAGYQEIQRLQTFHEMAHDAVLLGIMRKVLGGTAFPHPLKIARVAFPDHYEASTPPHQDWPNNQGTPDLTAAWVPACDITPELGGLAVLRGSSRWGVLPLARHFGAGNRCAVIPNEMAEACRWVTTDFAMGDVVLFPSTTVHAALDNTSEWHLRLSVDFRYQLEGEALTEGCLEPHFQRLTWAEIYEGWDSDELQYYWKDLDYEVVPFEILPIEGDDGGDELKAEDIGEILRYASRVEARSARRMERLAAADGTIDGAAPEG